MTNPTDPRVEAAAQALFFSYKEYEGLSWHNMFDQDKNYYRDKVAIILKVADQTAWNADIKQAPGQRSTVMVQLKTGRVTFANNEFPQGEDGWVDLLWPADGQDIPEAEIVAWRTIPRYQPLETTP